jgi:hypothetical protein
MMRKLTLVVFPILLFCSQYGLAQLWTGVIDPSRATDWSSTGIFGGLPDRTTLCSTLSPGVTAAQINSAIASCPSGQVVFLNAGTYNLSAGIDFANHSNVTLRGAGPDQTILVFSNNVNCQGQGADVCVRQDEVNWPGGPSNTANWTSGYAKGTTQIVLDNVANIKPGNTILVLDQLNDSSDAGTIFVCETGGVCAQEGPAAGERAQRAQQQLVLATAVSGNTVTISPGIYMPNWRTSQSPGAWWGNSLVVNVGIENMTLDHTNSPDTPTGGIMFFNAYNCWVKNVKSLNAGRNHVWLYVSSHVAIRNSYFYGTKNALSQSYGIELYQGSDNLIENNIFQHITSPMMVNGSASGTVFGHNFATDDFYSGSANWMMGSNWLHGAGSDMILMEGNEGAGFIADNIHGTHHFVTTFRNQFIGWETGKTAQTTPIHIYQGSRYMNVIGNVLGKQGYHTQYQDLTPSGVNSDASIFTLGWAGNEGSNGCCPNDPKVATSLMRWGNFDVVNAAAQWNSAEVPSGLSQYANPVPASHTLPASFYLSAKPSWWGTMPWPDIGPDVSGGSDSTGHVFANPAQACFNSTSKDANGILIFNANNCYPPGTRPLPPPNVRAVVQ